MFFKNNFRLGNHGISLIELTISMALVAGMSLGTYQMLSNTNKNSQNFEKSSSVIFLEKSIASYLYSKEGCQQFVGIKESMANDTNKMSFDIKRMIRKIENEKVTADFTDSTGAQVSVYSEGDIVGQVKIEEMKIESLKKLNNKSDSGILTAQFKFLVKDENGKFSSDSREFTKSMYVPVGLTTVGGDVEVSDCELNKTQMYDSIVSKLCTDSFFKDTGLPIDATASTCAESILFVENEIKKSICEDITGSSSNFSTTTGLCNFAGTHAGKMCGGTTRLVGFNASGGLICQ